MGRPVEAGSYERILDALRRLAPEAALGADVMVGFPGETEDDFEELRGFLDRSPLTYFHVFSVFAAAGDAGRGPAPGPGRRRHGAGQGPPAPVGA